ncbi:MAG: hypothetical protein ACR2G3_00520 [Solirubrobacterales bacterium]
MPGAATRAPLALRYADMLLLALALPIFVLADFPLIGYITAAVAWVVQHVVWVVSERRATGALRRGDKRSALGAVGVSMVGRLWIVTLPIFLVGIIVEREAGLAAAVLTVALVTAHLGAVAMTRLFHPQEAER